jgi:hypothetical protein
MVWKVMQGLQIRFLEFLHSNAYRNITTYVCFKHNLFIWNAFPLLWIHLMVPVLQLQQLMKDSQPTLNKCRRTDHTESTASSSYCVLALRGRRLDRKENTTLFPLSNGPLPSNGHWVTACFLVAVWQQTNISLSLFIKNNNLVLH